MKQLLLALLVSAGPACADEPWQGRSVAFFGVTFLDMSTEGDLNGVRPDEIARIEMVERQAAEAMREHGLEILDLAPVADDLRHIRNPAQCNGCDVRIAGKLGADYAVVSEVQKTSNLILAINLYVKDVASGRQIRGQAVDIRGNTDESWQRGMRYILERNVFR
ncbi:DUF3280 domain-containing protein [Rhodobacter sp. NSM]|uniref:DUF3280 domain-containing protein n=1 Tax=Rhodobacter sp. NSM TaxID=3457501 RepID=UPI003FD23B49